MTVSENFLIRDGIFQCLRCYGDYTSGSPYNFN
jgi:hypothetical protein